MRYYIGMKDRTGTKDVSERVKTMCGPHSEVMGIYTNGDGERYRETSVLTNTGQCKTYSIMRFEYRSTRGEPARSVPTYYKAYKDSRPLLEGGSLSDVIDRSRGYNDER